MKSVPLKEAWSGEADCRHCTLRQSALFAGLKDSDLDHIHDSIDRFNLPPGSSLYRTDDPGDSMFTLRSGLVKLVQYLPDGTPRIVRLTRTADVLGLECLVEPQYHQHATVLQHAQVCRYPTTVVRRLSADNPRLFEELMNRWHRALAEADTWLTELSTGSAKQRVARLIIHLSNPENSRCELFSREDMAAMLGITTETASRTMAGFKRQSLLVETSHNVFLIDIPNLRRLADE